MQANAQRYHRQWWWWSGWLVCLWACTTSVALAAPQAPLPGPAAPVVQSRIWPPAVYLGERFAYRVTLRATPGFKPLPPSKLKLGQARLQGTIQVQKRQDRLIVKIPLAIFLVQRYGPQKLPPFAMMFQTSSGPKRLWLPGATFEVRARYAATRHFRLRGDPKLPFVKARTTPTPSHEWRALPAPPPQKPRAGAWPLSWLLGAGAILLAALLWGFAMWQRRRPVLVEDMPDPFAIARAALHSLGQTPVTEREGLRASCTQMLHILRDYLQERMPAQTRHLTSHELCQFFAQAPTAPQPGVHPPPWFGGLQALLHHCEPICFAPPTIPLDPAQGLPTQLQQTHQLLDTIEAWQSARDQEAAQNAAMDDGTKAPEQAHTTDSWE